MKTQRPDPITHLVDADPSFWTHDSRPGVLLGINFKCPIHNVGEDFCYLGVQFRNPKDDLGPFQPQAPAWDWNREEDPSKLTVSPSIRVLGGADWCEWHGFIREGQFEHCGDSR